MPGLKSNHVSQRCPLEGVHHQSQGWQFTGEQIHRSFFKSWLNCAWTYVCINEGKMLCFVPLMSNEKAVGWYHYDDVIMTMLASQITSLTVVYSIVYSGVNQRKHQSSASLAFLREIHRGPMNFPHKWPVTRKMFPFDDVIMIKEEFQIKHFCNHCKYNKPRQCYSYYHN